MKTVKEVAQELDVSDVTIYAHLKKNHDKLKSDVVKKKGVTHIKENGIKLLKISLGIIQVPEIKESLTYEDIINDISLNLNKYNEELREDLKLDNKILSEEIKSIKKQNELLIELMRDKKSETFLRKLRNLFRK